jgi:hypothetical protein
MICTSRYLISPENNIIIPLPNHFDGRRSFFSRSSFNNPFALIRSGNVIGYAFLSMLNGIPHHVVAVSVGLLSFANELFVSDFPVFSLSGFLILILIPNESQK